MLEKYRKIYLLLRELETTRWTERERQAILADIRDQIELVWMTGELHLEKPTVEHEVLRGLHFFDETLFEKAPEMIALLEGALEHHYPGQHFELPPFFQFGSWIGGDRDGNPHVTTTVTGWALRQNALAALRHYRERIVSLARMLSITERALPVPEGFRETLAHALKMSGEGETIAARNPGEPYRQFLTTVLRKLDATAVRAGGGELELGQPNYANADELIHDLRLMERALAEANSPSIAARPGQARAPGRGAVPLLHRAARPAREHHAHDASPASVVVGERRSRRGQSAGARQPRMAHLAAARAGAAAHRRARSPPSCRPRPPTSSPCSRKPPRSGAGSTATLSARSSCP